MKLILNCPRALAITCLSHKGQNYFLQRTTFKVFPSRKQVCRLSLFSRLAVARGKPTLIVRKTQQLCSIHSKQLLYKQNFDVISQYCTAHPYCARFLHQAKVDSEIYVRFLLNDHVDLYFLFNNNSVHIVLLNLKGNEKKFSEGRKDKDERVRETDTL